jgi:hypothetical protein
MMQEKFAIRTQSFEQADAPDELQKRRWDVAFIGSADADKRSLVAREFTGTRADKSYVLRYDNNTIFIDDLQVTRARLQLLLNGAATVLIEATGLACPEILAALRACVKEKVKAISFLYLEPIEYRRNLKGNLTEHRDFDLSSNCRFKSVHGYMAELTDTPVGQAVFFLGYEKSRLGQAFEQEETLRRWQKYAVFGVPGYGAGWEVDALANNAHHLAADEFEVRYVAAASVNSAYKLLKGLRHDDKTEKPMLICPLGTKPHAIGAALFLVEHNEGQDATLLYDHPSKSSDRSREVKRWHVYDVSCNDLAS